MTEKLSSVAVLSSDQTNTITGLAKMAKTVAGLFESEISCKIIYLMYQNRETNVVSIHHVASYTVSEFFLVNSPDEVLAIMAYTGRLRPKRAETLCI